MLAEGIGLSGIVSILFTGIVSAYQISSTTFKCFSFSAWWFLRLCFVLGYEAVHLLKFVWEFSEICICLLPPNIIFGRNICVRISLELIYTSLWIFFQIVYPSELKLYLYTCRFIYMGFDIVMEQHSWSHVGFIFFSIVSLIIMTAALVLLSLFLVPYSFFSVYLLTE